MSRILTRWTVTVASGTVALLITAQAPTAQAQRAPAPPSTSPAANVVKLASYEDGGTLQTPDYRRPCLSASIVGTNPLDLTERDLSNRAELRMRSVGLDPVPFEKCGFPTDDAKVANQEQMNRVWFSVSPYFRDASTFTVDVEVRRIVKCRVAEPTAGDDGYRAALVLVDRWNEPVIISRPLRHEGRSSSVLEAVDRLMDGLLVRYLKANQK